MIQDLNIYLKQTNKTSLLCFNIYLLLRYCVRNIGDPFQMKIDQATFDHVKVGTTPFFFGIFQFVTQFTHVLRHPKVENSKNYFVKMF